MAHILQRVKKTPTAKAGRRTELQNCCVTDSVSSATPNLLSLPWNPTDGHRPLSSLCMARSLVLEVRNVPCYEQLRCRVGGL
jgi:hypothetical protein